MSGDICEGGNGKSATRLVIMEKRTAMDDNELRVRGIETLNKTLGATRALRFLTMLHRESTDYVKISHRLYDGQSIEEIFDRAKAQWKKQRAV